MAGLKLITALIATTVGMAACKSASDMGTNRDGGTVKVAVAADSLDSALDALDPEIVVSGTPDGYYVGMIAGAGGVADSPPMIAIRSIQSIRFDIYRSTGESTETLVMSKTTSELIASGLPARDGVEGSMTITAGIIWNPSDGNDTEGMFVVMTVRSDKGIVRRRAPISVQAPIRPSARRTMHLSLETRSSGGGVTFILTAERTSPAPAGEYLPSGERYRIEIFDDSGEMVWSTSNGKTFTQVIGTVEPDTPGERAEFQEYWDGHSDIMRGRLAKGLYRIVATIPAKPEPYILREEFTWSGR